MKNLTDININPVRKEKVTIDDTHCESTDDASSCSSIQETTLSVRTDNVQKLKDIQYETEINDQNILNKKNEKLINPCQNGNCYCFTSDSDDFKLIKNRTKQSKHRKQDIEVHRSYESCSRDSDIESFTSLDSSKDLKRNNKLPTILKNNFCRKEKCHSLPKPTHNLTAFSKTIISEKSTNRMPIIHIIQEFHKNSVVSEIRINRNQTKIRTEDNSINKKDTKVKKNVYLDNESEFSEFSKFRVMEDNIFSNKEDIIDENLTRKNKINLGGKLYQKRTGSESFRQKDFKSPPKKPPRSVSSCSEICKADDIIYLRNMKGINKNNHDVLENHSALKIEEIKNYKNIRKSFPLDNKSRNRHSNGVEANKVLNLPSVEKEDPSNKNINYGWIRPDTDIIEMLESNKIVSEQSFQQKPEAQIGWQIPSKLDIDTVDGLSNTLPNDSHNFAKNMESKSTPIKSDFTNETSSSIKKQFKEFICNSNKKYKKENHNYNKEDLNSSFREKAKISTKVFLINSKQKLVEMVTGRTDKGTLSKIPTKKNVAVQTNANLFLDNINDDSFCNNCLDSSNRKISSRKILQSPYSNLSAKDSAQDFDFTRIINSPKVDKSTYRKLSFSPKKLIKNLNYRPVCMDHRTSDNCYYKSFDNHINNDFTLSSINDILLSIRAKLESTDYIAENTFREIEQRENNSKHCLEIKEDIKENNRINNRYNISAQAEIHNNPQQTYSECEEEKIVIIKSPSNHSLNEISHYFINNDPNAIYATVKKTTKSFNANDILPNVNKSELSKESQKYLENLEQNNIDDENILENSQIRNVHSVNNVTRNSLEYFEDGEEVEYESVNDDLQYIRSNNISQIELKEESLLMDTDVVDGFLNRNIDFNLKSPTNNDLKCIQKPERKTKSSPLIYINLKKKFRDSFNKGKFLLKKDSNLFSSSPKLKDVKKQNNFYGDKNNSTIWDESDLGIYKLYSETPTVSEQLQKAVSLCRKIPYFDSTLEAVEAERLLLYSTLKSEKVKNIKCSISQNTVLNGGNIIIESINLGISSDINHDIFFNYFYIAVFSYRSVIKSSSFAEKLENFITFKNCNIVFNNINQNSVIKCDIYMLRLRKILNNTKKSKNQEQIVSHVENLDDSLESGGNEILSRFKLQACFELNPKNFIQYTIDKNCKNSALEQIICLHSKKSTTVPLILLGRATHLKNEVIIQATIEILFPKLEIESFISVQDINNKHNWNRFWCKVDDFTLKIWKYPQECLEKEPIYSFNLCTCSTYPVKVVDRSLCARLRSFFLTIAIGNDEKCYENVFFSADDQDHLNFWIEGLNRIMEFVNCWMQLKEENNDFST